MTHELKTWPRYFRAVLDGAKTFEIRRNNDRHFSVGDVLRLREWMPETESYTGREVQKVVNYELSAGEFAINGFSVMAISDLHTSTTGDIAGAQQELGHSRSCPELTPLSDDSCTCGLKWRRALATEQSMHAAWRKRAEEAEAEVSRAQSIAGAGNAAPDSSGLQPGDAPPPSTKPDPDDATGCGDDQRFSRADAEYIKEVSGAQSIAGAGNAAPAASTLAGQAGPGDAPPPETRDERQKRVHDWCAAAFGAGHAASIPQRGIRLVEEAIEAAQAANCDPAMVHKLVDHVFSKEPGSLKQEIGGVGITVLALAQASGTSAEAEEIREMERVLAKQLEYFAARNKAKNDAGFDVEAPPATTPQTEEVCVHRLDFAAFRECGPPAAAWRPPETCPVEFATLPTAIRCQLPLGHPRPVREDGVPCHAGQDAEGRIVVFGEGQAESKKPTPPEKPKCATCDGEGRTTVASKGMYRAICPVCRGGA